MEETIEYCYQYNGRHLSVACGGPIYVSNYVGSMTSVPDFKASLLQEIRDLEAVLLLADDFIEDLSVDDLKVFTEEELVEMALKEEFDEFEHTSGNDESLQILELANSTDDQVINFNKEIVISRVSVNGSSTLESSSSLNDSSMWMCSTDVSEKKVQQKRSKKRGRHFDRNTRAAELESCYFEKVKQLAKIKQRQDEDKLAARLHSFSGNSKSMEGAIITLDKIEKMQSLRLMTSSVKVKALTSNVHVPVYYPEVILCVEIYHQSTSKKVQEFLVLGSQNLTELRDNIYCLTDKLMQAAEKCDASGYFLIEETFCNDLRSPSATDYSKPIFDWLENRRNEASEKWEFIMSGELKKKQKELLGNLDISNLPNFKAVDMHKIRFCDLRFRLGAGYLYCHQGNCKHIIVFRDMRLIHPDDSHNKADYPLLTFQIKPRQRKCSVCQIYLATKMTVDDKWAPEDPCYFCIKCYFLLHYKEDNTLLYPHTVYDDFHE
ncbi:hypothetical protein M5K25_028045 [Dendrobium thyrsiflorum]|uniref:snRNA-activating protein complex subunit n=1 Tax=Dendrobium thyrsiflorum TaxID=117978 RepID=A0ABD0TVK7_DENTH